MRCILRPVFSKYPLFNQKAKFLFENKQITCRWQSHFGTITKDLPKNEIKDLNVPNKKRSANALLGLLSGCCFSKTATPENEVAETKNLLVTEKSKNNSTENLITTINVSYETKKCAASNSNKEHTPNVNIKVETLNDQYAENAIKHEDMSFLSAIDVESNCEELSTFNKNKRQKLDATFSKDIAPSDKNIEDVKTVKRKKKKPKESKEIEAYPNYFVAFQVSEPTILENLTKIQNHIVENDERLASVLVSVPKSHITLMVMYLHDAEAYTKALDVLKTIRKEMNTSMATSPLKLKFKGIGNFRHQVVFAKVEEDEGFMRLKDYAKNIENHFRSASILSTDKPNKTFNPHLTLLKLSKNPKLYRKGIKKINPSHYDTFKDQEFGEQIVTSIQLLKMCGPPDEKGYYTGDELLFDISGSKSQN